MKKKCIIVAVIFLMGLMTLSAAAYAEGDMSVEMARTGLFHGQVALGGVKQMLYYFEKVAGMGGGDENFLKHVAETLKHTKEAYALFEKAIGHAKASVEGEGSSEKEK